MIGVDMSKVTYHDIMNAPTNELKKKYKLNDRQLETQVRNHLYGATREERTREYQRIYSKR